jgi:Flp pilus assembly protein CpaB
VKRSNRLVILVGVLLAILAFVAIVILLNSRPTSDGTAEEPTTETVLVATQDIAIGDPVTPDVVEELEIDPEAVQQTPLRSVSQVSGQPAIFAIPQGSQVTAEAIGATQGGIVNVPALLQPGEKAIAIRVDEQNGTGFLVRAGNLIDIIVSANLDVLQPTADSLANPDAPQRFEPVEGLEATRSVKAVLQNKRVLYVSATRAEEPEPTDTNGDGVIDETDQQPVQAAIESVIIVFAGTAQDAEAITFAQRDRSELSSERTEIPTSITVIIRSADDDAIEETVGVTIDSLVTEYGLRIPSIVDQLNEEATP